MTNKKARARRRRRQAQKEIDEICWALEDKSKQELKQLPNLIGGFISIAVGTQLLSKFNKKQADLKGYQKQ